MNCIFDVNYPFLSKVFQGMSTIPKIVLQRIILSLTSLAKVLHKRSNRHQSSTIHVAFVLYVGGSEVRWSDLSMSLKKYSTTLFQARYWLLSASNFLSVILPVFPWNLGCGWPFWILGLIVMWTKSPSSNFWSLLVDYGK